MDSATEAHYKKALQDEQKAIRVLQCVIVALAIVSTVAAWSAAKYEMKFNIQLHKKESERVEAEKQLQEANARIKAYEKVFELQHITP